MKIITHSETAFSLLWIFFFFLFPARGQNKKVVTAQNPKHIDSLFNVYQLQGYIDAEIKKVLPDSLYIEKGEVVKGVYIIRTEEGETEFKVKDTVFVPTPELSGFMRRHLISYLKKGYAFASIQLSGIKRNDSILYARLSVDKNKRRSIDSIIIRGYEKVPRNVLYRNSGIKPGSLFYSGSLRNAVRNIEKSGIAHSIRTPEVLFTRDSTLVFLYLRKKKGNAFDGIAGFSYDRTAPTPLQISGNIHLELNNSFNHGEKISVNWIAQSRRLNRLKTSLLYPYIAKSAFSVKAELLLEKTDTSYVNKHWNTGVSYDLDEHNALGLIWQNASSFGISEATDEYADYRTNRYGITWQYRSENEGRHWNIENTLTYGKREEERQTFGSLRYHILIPLKGTKGSLDIHGDNTYLFSPSYYVNELMKTGGTTSLRGFEEGQFLTKGYLITSAGYIYSLNTAHALTAFGDAGYLFESDKAFTAYAMGIGYRYRTEDSTLSVEYAIGNTSLSAFSLEHSKIHIRYGVLF